MIIESIVPALSLYIAQHDVADKLPLTGLAVKNQTVELNISRNKRIDWTETAGYNFALS